MRAKYFVEIISGKIAGRAREILHKALKVAAENKLSLLIDKFLHSHYADI